HLHQALEEIVARDEVGLRIDLDHNALRPLYLHADQALGGNAARLLGRLGETFLAQPILRRRHVAVGLGEGRLAVHHPGARRLAQLLDHLCADICHRPYSCPLRRSKAWMAGTSPAMTADVIPPSALWLWRSSQARDPADRLPRRRCAPPSR